MQSPDAARDFRKMCLMRLRCSWSSQNSCDMANLPVALNPDVERMESTITKAAHRGKAVIRGKCGLFRFRC